MTDYWFKPKSHGYGATPSNWKGWLATLGFMAASLLLAVAFIVLPALDGSGPNLREWLIWAGVTAAVTLYFIRLSRARTDGEWKWRWGNRDV